MLIDRFGRRHTRLRISVTDRCNLRCTYCMPESNPDYMPRDHLLTFEEIDRIVRVAAGMGVTHVRLTGGEPLVRPQIDQLVQRLNAIPAIQDVSITTNAILIPQHAQSLWDAGLRNVNISCDALERKVFAAATRRDLLPTVLDGIDAARSIGMNVKINAIAQRGITEGQLAAFAEWTRRTNIPIRFIEFMPLDADQHWSDADVYSGREILQQLELLVMPLVSIDAEASQMNTEQAPAAPSRDYMFGDGRGRIGIIASVTQPFCGNCNRFRLTADGRLRSCLFGSDDADLRELVRTPGINSDQLDQRLADAMAETIAAKKRGHGTDDLQFARPDRPMYAIGG